MEMKNNIEIKISTTTMRNTGCIPCFFKPFTSYFLSHTFFSLFLLSCIFIFNLSYGLIEAEGAACTSQVASGNWNTAGTWNCGHVPTTSDTVTIANGHAITVNVSTANVQSLTVSGNLTVGAYNISVAGTTTVNGTMAHSSSTGTKTYSGMVTINSGGIWTNAGHAAITFGGGLTNNSGGSFTWGNGTQTFTNGGIVNNGTWPWPATGPGTFVFNTNSQTISGSSSVIVYTLTVNGVTLTNNSNGLTLGSGMTGTGTLAQGNNSRLNVWCDSSSITISTLNATADNNTVYYYNSQVNQTVKPINYYHLHINKPGYIATLGGATTVNGNLTVSAGTLQTSTYDLSVAGTTSVTGTLDNNGAGTRTFTGAVTINNGGQWTNSGNAAITFGGNLTINSGGAFTVTGNDFSVDGTTSVSGTLTHSSATGIKTYTGLVTINSGGLWNNTGNSAVTFGNGLTVNSGGVFNAGIGSVVQTFSGGNLTNYGSFIFNAVTNSGFETGNWGGAEVQTSAEKYSGTYSGQLTASGTNIFSARSNQMPVSNFTGKTFTVSADAKATVTTGNLYLRLQYYNSSNVYIAHKDWKIFTTSTTGWQNYSVTIDPSHYLHPDTVAGTAYIYVDFGWWNASNNPNGTVYVDNYTLSTDTSSQFVFSGTSAQTINGNAIGIETLTVNNSSGVTNNITTVSGLTVSTTLNGTGKLIQGTNAILNIGGTSGITTLDAVTNTGNTVNYSSSSTQSVLATSYKNLTFSGSGAKSVAADTSVGGNLSIAPTGSATASIGTGLNISVSSLSLGGLGRNSGTWGSTSSAATNQNNTYFAATTGYVTVSTDTRTTPSITISPTASGIIYGQDLSASTLSGGSASVPGSFAFTTPSTTPNSAGTYSASVTFTPTDLAIYKPVTGNVDVAVAKASTTITIGTHTPNPSGFNQTITVNYSVVVTAPGAGIPTGNVTVSSGLDTCTGTVEAGNCLLTLTTNLGPNILTAVYAEDTNFNGSTSPSVSHTVIPTTTTTIVTHTPDPSVVGQTVTVTYTVVVNAPGVDTPTGNVTISDGTDTCTGTVAAGTCSLTLTSAGTKALTAVYAGDTNFNGSTSLSVSHTVNKASTTTTIGTHTPAPSVVGQTVTVSYTVAVNAPGSGTPAGNVTISDGTASCAASVAVGTCTLKPTSPGSKTLTATYAGNIKFSTSTSAGVSHNVDKADQTITFNALPVMNVGDADLDPGATASSGLTVSYASSNPSVATIVSGKIHIIAVGTSTITASQAGDSNYNTATPFQQTLDVSATPHPSEPSDISLSSMRTGGPIISWSTVSDAVTYNIYRSTNNVTWTLIVSLPHPASSFRDTKAPRSNTTYYWTVTAENTNGESTKPAGVAGRTALLSGWNMISVPVNTGGAEATSVYGSWAYWIWTWISEGNYDPDYNGYWQENTGIEPGTSQFVWVNNYSTEVNASGSANPAAVTVTLLPGWTMIANHTQNNLSSIKTNWLIDGAMPLSTAITSILIGGDIYWWNGSTYDSMNITLDDPIVEPWKGYWILNMDSVNHTLTLQ